MAICGGVGMRTLTKAEKARELRYKKPMLADFGYQVIMDLLYEIEEAACEVHWWCDNEDGTNTLTNALDGNDEEAEEFKIAFADLEAKCEQLRGALGECWDIREYFDDCTVALIGNRYQSLGYDDCEEDYFAMTSYEENLAFTEAGKRVTRWTKSEMLSKIGQCMGIVMAVLDIKEQHDRLSTILEMLKSENTGLLKTLKEINDVYEEFAREGRYSDAEKKLDRLVEVLPDRFFIE